MRSCQIAKRRGRRDDTLSGSWWKVSGETPDVRVGKIARHSRDSRACLMTSSNDMRAVLLDGPVKFNR